VSGCTLLTPELRGFAAEPSSHAGHHPHLIRETEQTDRKIELTEYLFHFLRGTSTLFSPITRLSLDMRTEADEISMDFGATRRRSPKTSARHSGMIVSLL
jgi:hypothetical protein